MLFGTHSIARNRNIYQAEEKIMSRSSIALSVTFLAAMLVGSVQAQTEPSGPAAELKKLDFMSGDWTAEGTINPHAGMPGGKFTETTHADWMQGNYFLVQHTDGDFGSMGKVKELAVLGYDPDKKTYTYHAFDSVGAAANSRHGRRRHLDVDGRRAHGWNDHEGPLHHEGAFANLVHHEIRAFQGWHELDHGHGRQSHQEVIHVKRAR
jgi:Protein of unknown function (DUF1579)